jgi:AAA family ATP:ADP antiporter
MADIATNISLNSSDSSPKNLNNPNKLLQILYTILPIKLDELPRFLFITLLMFCILFIQNLIRAQKDSIVIPMIGAETTTFLKVWGVMPTAFIITLIYVKLVNIMRSDKIFYLIMSCFICFFALFGFYIFPNHEALHLSKEHAQSLVSQYPNLKWFILILANWSFSLFYIIAELWPNAVFGLLFWQFVNNITSIEQSKRFYPLFGLLGQTGLIIAGYFLERLDPIGLILKSTFDLKAPQTVISVGIVLSVVVILGIIALFSFWVINQFLLDQAARDSLKFQVKKNHMSMKDSISMILGSRYIRLIAILLICYGIAINLVEGPWKDKAANIYKTTTEFSAFQGSYLKFTGIFTILFVILGSNIVRKFGWFSAAIITPIMVLSTGLGFFIISNFDTVGTFMMISFGLTDPIMLAIIVGAIQNVLSKSSKYTLFDSTKEMSYVPLDPELKTKGKAAADVIGTKLGKSASAFLQSMIFMIIPAATYKSISEYLMVVFTAICLIWIWAVIQLSKEYNAAVLAKNNEK